MRQIVIHNEWGRGTEQLWLPKLIQASQWHLIITIIVYISDAVDSGINNVYWQFN